MSKGRSLDLTGDAAFRAKNMLAETVLVATRQRARSESKARVDKEVEWLKGVLSDRTRDFVAKILNRIETSDDLKMTLAEIRKQYGIGS
jgi:hypothetical protein